MAAETQPSGPPRVYGPGYYLKAWRALLHSGYAVMMQYRFAVLIWAVWGFVGPLVSLAVWSAATEARGGAAGGFTRGDFAAYFLTFLVYGHVTMSWDAFEFGFRVRTGSLSPHLLKPLHPIHNDAMQNIGFKVVTSMMLVPVWLILIPILQPTPPASIPLLLLSIPSLLLAAVTRYIWQYALATLAFWTTRVEAINQLWFTVDAFLGGRIAPLALLPGGLGVLAVFAPFRSLGAFSVELAMGRLTPPEVLTGFLLQFAWLGFGIVVFRVLWAAGVKQYSAVGA